MGEVLRSLCAKGEARHETMDGEQDRDDVLLLVDTPSEVPSLNHLQRTFQTPEGSINAIIIGDPSNSPTIVTYHDVGLSYANCFGGFLTLPNVHKNIARFAIVRMIAPGHEENASDIPRERYPESIDSMVSQLGSVISQLKIHHC